MSTIKMPALWARILVSFIANFILLAVTAAVIGEPVQAAFFPEIASDNPNILFILGGALLMSTLLAILYPYFNIDVTQGWFSASWPVAVMLGLAIYFATHMVQAGYTVIPPLGWLLEGLYDSLAPMASLLAMAFLAGRVNRA